MSDEYSDREVAKGIVYVVRFVILLLFNLARVCMVVWWATMPPGTIEVSTSQPIFWVGVVGFTIGEILVLAGFRKIIKELE